ncbi:MAG: hypothetical protein WA955_06320 [Diaphorobacter nitroreducens]|uniref:hypothetical protein n=1 Tax=Diaphorobacter nitroreducens TaxID=164759 RepID=UPI003C773B4E
MTNTENTFTITVIGNGIGASAGAIQEAISQAYRLNPSIASGLALAKVTALAVGAEGFTVAIAVQSGDPERIAAASTKAIASIVLSTEQTRGAYPAEARRALSERHVRPWPT